MANVSGSDEEPPLFNHGGSARKGVGAFRQHQVHVARKGIVLVVFFYKRSINDKIRR